MERISSAPSISLGYPPTESSAHLAPSFSDSATSTLSFKSLLEDPVNPIRPVYTPTRTEITPVTLSPIPITPVREFQPYLHEISQEYARYSKQKRASLRRYLEKHGKLEGSMKESSINGSLLRRSSVSTILRPASESSYPNSNSETITYDIDDNVNPSSSLVDNFSISSVPSVFFQSDFNLDDPQIFDVVSEHIDITQTSDAPNSNRNLLLNNSMLQEKISWYLDTVELHLLQEIENASDSFPMIIDNLKQLKKETRDNVEETKHLLEKLTEVNVMCDRHMDAISSEELACHQLTQLKKVVQTLEDIYSEHKKVSEDVKDQRFLEAINGINSIVTQLKKKSTELNVDLLSLPSVKSLREEHKVLYHTVSQSVVQQFSKFLTSDMHKFSTILDSNELKDIYLSKNRLIPSVTKSLPSAMEFDADFLHEVDVCIDCLTLTDSLQAALTLYKTAVFEAFENLAQQYFTDGVEMRSVRKSSDLRRSLSAASLSSLSDSSRRSSSAANPFQSMSITEFAEMLTNIYFSSLECLRRIRSQIKVLIDILSKKDTKQYHLSVILNDLMATSSDVVTQQVTTINNLRFRVLDTYPPNNVIYLFSLHIIFHNELESLCGITQSSFIPTIMRQLLDWFKNFQRYSTQKLASSFERELWEAIPVEPSCQDLANRVFECSGNTPVEWTRLLSPEAEKEDENHRVHHVKVSEDCTATVSFGKQSLHIVRSSVTLLETLDDYGKLLAHFSRLAPEFQTGMLDMFRTLNSRVYQLILGAGTVRSSGLSKVLGKHIALASQTIALFQLSLNSMCRYLSRVTGTRLTNETNKLDQDFTVHHLQIHDKFVSLMRERVAISCSQIASLSWDIDSPHGYIIDLSKSLIKLYKVLHRYSQRDCVEVIPDVIRMFEDRLQLELTDIARNPSKWPGVRIDLSYFYDMMASKCGYAGDRTLLEKFERTPEQQEAA
ncbi:GARP complex subunit Vps54 [Schizosaccharomyces pombe]|uniref:Vacuolar protein sorting-associated protein 54 n=1 Tax=Schizosaccharomyces pombe (strain 972 / ATCC 24843) TaxID=284812 RepID=VPS54_SCHPO|nr:putative GARP complex subunit Vps54 [Schizosaccharomyces pombe]O14093.1 RecName: Full=Vacuolar protein sorting-associated protein 54 [Schizosaccharomyces pombe 972h-]CAB16266.1 GARP complex subunit Vps54 (predicted) [Schizosaccharomyces pombe]|eukprot:NP_594389.1 putative GARP complex subunit Vps54 [Schizosaccharomyces pombe]